MFDKVQRALKKEFGYLWYPLDKWQGYISDIIEEKPSVAIVKVNSDERLGIFIENIVILNKK